MRREDIVKNIAQVRLITSGGNSLYDTVSAPKLMTLNDIGKFQDEKTKSRKRTKLETDIYRVSHESYASGRDVNIAELAEAEHSLFPPSLTDGEGKLRTSNKSELTKILIGDNFCTVLTNPQEKPECRVIDGMALLRAIVKPKVCRYWNDWMIAVNSKIKEQFTQTCRRVDIVFDSYDRRSTKSSCRNNRAKNSTQYGRIEPHMKFPYDVSYFFFQ